MAQLLLVRILWASLSLSTVFFLVVLLALERPPTPPDATLAAALGAAALSMALASFVVPQLLYRSAIAQLKVATQQEEDPAGMPGVTRRTVAADPKAAIEAIFRLFQPSFIISMAMTEAIALLGFVLGFLGFGYEIVIWFFAISWLLAAYRFPTLERILSPVERAKGIVLPRSLS